MNDTPDTPPPESATPREAAPPPRRLDFDLRDAAAFLTQIPVGAPRNVAVSQYCWAFPLIGAAIGAIGGGVYMLLLAAPLPPLIAALIALGVLILLTGALHEDGLADTADGFGAGFSGGFGAARILEIMRDSRIGAFGVLALILSLGVRAAALAALAGSDGLALAAMIAAGAVSRAAMPALMWRLSLASASGLAAAAGRPCGWIVMVSLLLGGVAAFLALGPGPALATLLVVGLSTLATGALAQRQIQGYNGDVLGAAQQIGEVAVLLCILILQGRGVL